MIRVSLIADLVEEARLPGTTAVVIDVLRASTTIVHALAAGAKCVVPCVDVDVARRLAGEMAGAEPILGGERQGLRIEGFDLGNSPAEYTAATVGGRPVLFTTTNGTRALDRVDGAEKVMIGGICELRGGGAGAAERGRGDLGMCGDTRRNHTGRRVVRGADGGAVVPIAGRAAGRAGRFGGAGAGGVAGGGGVGANPC